MFELDAAIARDVTARVVGSGALFGSGIGERKNRFIGCGLDFDRISIKVEKRKVRSSGVTQAGRDRGAARKIFKTTSTNRESVVTVRSITSDASSQNLWQPDGAGEWLGTRLLQRSRRRILSFRMHSLNIQNALVPAERQR